MMGGVAGAETASPDDKRHSGPRVDDLVGWSVREMKVSPYGSVGWCTWVCPPPLHWIRPWRSCACSPVLVAELIRTPTRTARVSDGLVAVARKTALCGRSRVRRDVRRHGAPNLAPTGELVSHALARQPGVGGRLVPPPVAAARNASGGPSTAQGWKGSAVLATYEVERRFLVADASVVPGTPGRRIEQAYLWQNDNGYAIRVRRTHAVSEDGQWRESTSSVTLKGPKAPSGRRLEEETELTPEDAAGMIEGAHHVVRKTRYDVVFEGNRFDVDVFEGSNEGLVIAEFEATAASVAALAKPGWCGVEVTRDHRYNNESLAVLPWRQWPENAGLGR